MSAEHIKCIYLYEIASLDGMLCLVWRFRSRDTSGSQTPGSAIGPWEDLQ